LTAIASATTRCTPNSEKPLPISARDPSVAYPWPQADLRSRYPSSTSPGPAQLGRWTRPASAQPVVVPPSKPFGMAELFFSALNSSVAWVLFHSTESPPFV